jgi:predicted O-methyltransferase YrrM
MSGAAGELDYGFLSLPGWFSPLDAKMFLLADAAQRSAAVEGDLLEIGAYMGRSAVVLGQLQREGERLIVSDIFGEAENNEESILWRTSCEVQKPSVEQFSANYLRFHATLPEIRVGPSSSLDAGELGRKSFRLLHVDGAHDYENVAHDLSLTRDLAAAGAVIAFDDISQPAFPGIGAAIWPEVKDGRLRPLIVGQKLYATWDVESPVADTLLRLVEAEPGVGTDRCQLADFEALLVSDQTVTDEGPASWKTKSKRFLRNWAPPAVYEGAKKVRAAARST